MRRPRHFFNKTSGRWIMALLLVLLTSLAVQAEEAYVEYTPSKSKLTFYFDNKRASRQGKTYGLNQGTDLPGWFSNRASVTQVQFDSTFVHIYPPTTHKWFYSFTNLKTITGLEYLSTDLVQDMSHMFDGCNNLTSLNLNSFVTQNVTDMNHMFFDCRKLREINLSNFDTHRVKNMESMFQSCSELTTLNLKSFETDNVSNMTNMFRFCSNLATIVVSDRWGTKGVTESSNMFLSCYKLVGGQGTRYNDSHADKAYAHIDGGPSNPGYLSTSYYTPIPYACYTKENSTLTFYNDGQFYDRTGMTIMLNDDMTLPVWHNLDDIRSSITRVAFDPSFANARPTNTAAWFALENLESITGINYLNTSRVNNMSQMFQNCTKLTSIDLSGFNTSNVTDMTYMFENCTALTSLDLSSFNTSLVGCMWHMFNGCRNLSTIYAGNSWNIAAVKASGSMFYDCTSLVGGQGTTYDLNHLGSEDAHIDGGKSNPGYFTNPDTRVAYACYTPENATLTFYYDNKRNTRPGTTYFLNEDMDSPGWFMGNDSPITQVVFDSSFAAARPTSTNAWFYGMQKLETITNLNYLNTSEVEVMNMMFYHCHSLKNLDLSSFNTAKVIDMVSMFENCYNLMTLDMSSFNTGNLEYMSTMFAHCGNLQAIYVGNGWSTASVTEDDDVFWDCFKLVGGKGTTYDEDHINLEYAHIDGGPSNPGYLTDAGAH